MNPCKLYEIEDYENRKVAFYGSNEGFWIKKGEFVWIDQDGCECDHIVSRFDEEIWLPYEEPKDDNAIEELETTFIAKDGGLVLDRISMENRMKINEIIRHINKENPCPQTK